MLEDNLKAVIKPQYVDQLPKAVRSIKPEERTVEKLLRGRCQMDNYDEIVDAMGMSYFTHVVVITDNRAMQNCDKS